MRIAQTSTDGDVFFVFLHVLPQTKHCMPPWNTLTPFGGISLNNSQMLYMRWPGIDHYRPIPQTSTGGGGQPHPSALVAPTKSFWVSSRSYRFPVPSAAAFRKTGVGPWAATAHLPSPLELFRRPLKNKITVSPEPSVSRQSEDWSVLNAHKPLRVPRTSTRQHCRGSW